MVAELRSQRLPVEPNAGAARLVHALTREQLNMKTTHAVKAAGLCLLAGALTLSARSAEAVEGNTPYVPGISVGSAAGALPPPGVYFSDDNVFVTGGLKDNNGNSTGANVWADLNIPSVLWVPNIEVLGATYAVGLVQPYTFQGLDFTGLGGRATISNGLFNTILSPVNLSWNLHNGFLISTGLSIYLPDGYYQHSGGTTLQTSIANNFWTFEPGAAVSYLQNGWNLTLHGVIDVNTENDTTNYQSGDLLYIDYTATKTIGKWTVGAGGNYTQQFTDDTINGALVNGNGNRLEKILLGPTVSYNFGPVTLTGTYLAGLYAENTFNASYFHLAISFPL
jgi:hypothetical protein